MEPQTLHTLYQMLKTMRLSGMANELIDFYENPNHELMDTDAFIERLIVTEHDLRSSKKINKLIKQSYIRYPEAVIDEMVYAPERKLDVEAIEKLAQCEWIHEHKNLLITGLTGAGKTSTIREFVHSLNPSLYKVVYIQLSTVSVIDEAQYLSTNVFNDLTMLLNFEMDSKNYCILILSGQTSLNNILKKQIHDALRQRIVINYYMEGLKADEAQVYVEYCMKECWSQEKVFKDEAVRATYNIAGGSIRKLNNLLSKCLIEGANSEKQVIDPEIVMRAHNEVELG